MFEVLGSPRHCSPGRLHIRVIEAEIVVTHTSIFAADVKVEARHGVPRASQSTAETKSLWRKSSGHAISQNHQYGMMSSRCSVAAAA
jgi:hypothetical protein